MHETSGGLASQHALGREAWLPSMHWEGEGVGFPASTGKEEGGWLPSMHWEGGVGLASQHALGRGAWLPSVHWEGEGVV